MAKKKQLESQEDMEEALEVDDILYRNRNKYLLVNVVAKRARELNEGSRPAVRLEGPHNPLEVALAEVAAKKLNVVRREREKVMVDLVSST